MLDVRLEKRVAEHLQEAVIASSWEDGVRPLLQAMIERGRNTLEEGDSPEVRGEIKALRRLQRMTVNDIRASTK